MKIRQYNFSGNVRIVNLGDVHRGDSACNDALFRKIIAHIEKDPSCYWVSTGDLLNVALKNSKSDVYSSMSLEDEKNILLKELEPIASKCLSLVASNHHSRFDRETGMSLDALIAGLLNIPYLGGMGIINVTCDRASYYIAMHHGTGGGGARGSKVNSSEKLEGIAAGADLYLDGHTHSYATWQNISQYIDKKRGLLSEQISHFVTTGHFLNWGDSYAVNMKLKPMPQGSSIVELFAAGAGNATYKRIKSDLLY